VVSAAVSLRIATPATYSHQHEGLGVSQFDLRDRAWRYSTKDKPIATAMSSMPTDASLQRKDPAAKASAITPAPLMKSRRRVTCVPLIDPA